jgi:hypothetical protein
MFPDDYGFVGSLRLPEPIGFILFKKRIQILIGILKRARVRSTVALRGVGRSSNDSFRRYAMAIRQFSRIISYQLSPSPTLPAERLRVSSVLRLTWCACVWLYLSESSNFSLPIALSARG